MSELRRMSLPQRARLYVLTGILCAAACIVALYASEGYLEWTWRERAVAATAARLGRPMDRRGVREVIHDFRRQGVAATPCCVGVLSHVGARPSLRLSADPRELLPLAPAADRFMVFCNESGSYLTYQTDEHGFHNPSGIWNRQPIELVAFGDSMTQGMCVEREQHYTGILRHQYPALLNLGIRGSGPLIHLAVLKEYAAPLRPRIVLWGFFEGNDILDLQNERGVPILTKYLDRGFSQNLMEKQKDIDRLVDEIVARRLKLGWGVDSERVGNAVKLTRTRMLFGSLLTRQRLLFRAEDFDLFDRTLSEATSAVRAWGGQMYFVYLPDRGRFTGGDLSPYVDLRQRVLRIVAAHSIPLVDLVPIFAAHPNPASLWFYRASHYSEDGYRIVGETILRKLMGHTDDPSPQTHRELK